MQLLLWFSVWWNRLHCHCPLQTLKMDITKCNNNILIIETDFFILWTLLIPNWRKLHAISTWLPVPQPLVIRVLLFFIRVMTFLLLVLWLVTLDPPLPLLIIWLVLPARSFCIWVRGSWCWLWCPRVTMNTGLMKQHANEWVCLEEIGMRKMDSSS